MKFKSPHEHPIHVALTTGHTCVIPPDEGADIDPMFHGEAIKRGAEPVGVPIARPDPGSNPTKTDVITGVLQKMLDGNEDSDFKQDGSPDIAAVNRYCGFKVSREEVDAIFKTLTAGGGEGG